ncbi:hypothetical protein [Sodalis endosymbiont of Henestaris halophilus]|nr:hypothetical protein [Sodalis endosymbiont of Henestaris halophilus]
MNVGYEIVLDFMGDIWGHAEKFQGGGIFLPKLLAVINLTFVIHLR